MNIWNLHMRLIELRKWLVMLEKQRYSFQPDSQGGFNNYSKRSVVSYTTVNEYFLHGWWKSGNVNLCSSWIQNCGYWWAVYKIFKQLLSLIITVATWEISSIVFNYFSIEEFHQLTIAVMKLFFFKSLFQKF